MRVRDMLELDSPLFQTRNEVRIEINRLVAGATGLIDEEAAHSNEIASRDRRVGLRVPKTVHHEQNLRRLPSCDRNQVSQESSNRLFRLAQPLRIQGSRGVAHVSVGERGGEAQQGRRFPKIFKRMEVGHEVACERAVPNGAAEEPRLIIESLKLQPSWRAYDIVMEAWADLVGGETLIEVIADDYDDERLRIPSLSRFPRPDHVLAQRRARRAKAVNPRVRRS